MPERRHPRSVGVYNTGLLYTYGRWGGNKEGFPWRNGSGIRRERELVGCPGGRAFQDEGAAKTKALSLG